MFQGDRFLHPDLDFQVRFPRGWRTSNSNRAVGAGSPRGDAAIFLTADLPSGDVREVAETWVEKTKEKENISVMESKPIKIGELDAWRMKIHAGGGGGSVIALVTFVPYGNMTWRITGVSPSSLADDFVGRFSNTTRSFRPLTEEERASVQAERLRLAKARPGENLVELGRRYDNAWKPGNTAVYNAIFPNHRFEGGELVKVAQVEPYVPSAQ